MSEHGITIEDLEGLDLEDFDAADYLTNEETIAAYLTEVMNNGTFTQLGAAVGTVARARGMAEIAKSSGLSREALYKALRPNSHPRFETISKVCKALGVRLVAEAITETVKEVNVVALDINRIGTGYVTYDASGKAVRSPMKVVVQAGKDIVYSGIAGLPKAFAAGGMPAALSGVAVTVGEDTPYAWSQPAQPCPI